MPISRHLLACILVMAACGGDGAAAAEVTGDAESGVDTTSAPPAGDGSSTGEHPAVCPPGYEGCACTSDGLCLSGLACLSNLCVDPGTAAETSAADASTGNDAGTTTGADGTTTTGDESSSTTEPEPECLEADNYCADSQLQTCVGGFWQVSTCEEHCLLTGYHATGCENSDGCHCEGFADDVCEEASYNLCVCADLDFGLPCNQDQWNEFYDQCFQELNEYVECFYDYPITTPADCAPAEATCL